MIDNSLIIPTESPYDSDSIKRALLTYDKVYLFSPDDRDIIPSNIYMQLTTGMPMGMSMGPVRPLGKTSNYNDSFEKTLKEFKAAIKQGSLEILNAPIEHNTVTIGGSPLPKDTPPPDFVFGNYRNLISNPEFISTVSKGIDNNILMLSDDLEQLAPSGQEDKSFQIFVNGQQVEQNFRKAIYDGFCSSEEERLVLTRLCHSRIGFLMKSIGYCETKGINAFTTDPGLAGTIQLLERNYQQVVSDAQEKEKIMLFDNLSKLENLVFSEYIDSNALKNLSVSDILKMRTKSWGKANEGKTELKTTLKKIALENKDSEKFIVTCKNEIDKYLKDCNDYEHEGQKLKIKLICNFGTILTGGTAGTPLLEQIIAAPSIGLMVGLGSALTFIYGEKRLPEILDLLKKQEEMNELKGYSLFRPYRQLR